ncbi:retrovirus-related pol polyprotein from transposon TNT 1-94 [Tanacetum coccineum]
MDSMIPIGQKNTLAEYMILSGADNRPPMTKKYADLSATEKIQVDCAMKATNIILQGLPADIYSLVNHHRVAKDLWERVQLLMQVNTKFLNSLPPEWSKFVTDVKLVKYFHTTNYDQLHAYLEQHELHANEVRIIRERNQDPLTLFSPSQSPHYGSIPPTQHYSTTYPSTPLAISHPSTPYPNAYSSTVHQEACPQPPSVPQIEYSVSIVNQQTHIAKFPQIDFSLAVPVFKQGDDPIDAINKMMSFLSTVITSRQQRVVKCFNCQEKGHMARQCPKPKRKRDATWFREKVLLVKAQGNGKVLNKEELEFLAVPGIVEGPVTQSVITHNVAYQVDNLDAYDSDCDKISIAKAVLMANLSSYELDVLFEVPISNNTNNDMLNQSVQEISYSEPSYFVEHPENEIHSDSNIISYSQYQIESQNAAIQDTTLLHYKMP